MKRPLRSRPHRTRPIVEILEDRCVPARFTAVMELSNLPNTPSFGVTLSGFVGEDGTGSDVHGIGDINGDGIDDVAIGSPGTTITSAGQIYVVFGSATPTSLSLNSLNGTNGFIINGSTSADASHVGAAGDFNGDGIADLIIGAPDAQISGANIPGKAYVIYGKSTAFSATLNLGSIAAADGLTIIGAEHGGALGASVAGVGDVNNDTFDDVLIGAPNHDGGGASFRGQAFVIFGSDAGLPASITVSALDGDNGFAINGVAGFDAAGKSVAAAGDVNGDGFNDMLIGAPASFDGHVYVVYGFSSFPASLDLSSLDGVDGFTINPFADDCQIGLPESISGNADVNGDGRPDIILGSRTSDGIGLNCGEAYVIYGRALNNPFGGAFELSSLTGAGSWSRGFIVNGSFNGGFLGEAVGTADVNSDGIADLLLGAPLAYNPTNDDFTEGIVYVVFGRTGGFSTPVSVASLNGTNGFRIEGFGEFANAGSSVAAAGDFNGDGLQDLILGQPAPQNPSEDLLGRAFVIYGRYGPPTATLDSAPNVTTGGAISYTFTVTYTEAEGISISSLGAGDATVTGPDNVPIPVTLLTSTSTSATTRTATYQITPPGGFWDFRDNGTYTIDLLGNQVFSNVGRAALPAELGTFTVNITAKLIAVGNNAKSAGRIQVFTPDGSPMYTITAFAAPFAGGVRVAVGDVNNDGIPDIIAAPGEGTVTEILVFNGMDGSPLEDFIPIQPYGGTFTAGAFVAAGDFDGVPGAEIIVGPGAGPNNAVKVYDADGNELTSFVAYAAPYSGGVRVAAGNLSGDGRVEIVTAATTGPSSIKAFDQSGTVLWSIVAYNKSGGNFVTIGDIDGNGSNEVITGPEGKNAPKIQVYIGATGAPVTGVIKPYASDFFKGVRVAVIDTNGDGKLDILASTSSGRTVKVYDWLTKKKIDSFFAFETNFKSGLYVAGG